MHNLLELSKRPDDEGIFLFLISISWMKKLRLTEIEYFQQIIVLGLKISTVKYYIKTKISSYHSNQLNWLPRLTPFITFQGWARNLAKIETFKNSKLTKSQEIWRAKTIKNKC